MHSHALTPIYSQSHPHTRTCTAQMCTHRTHACKNSSSDSSNTDAHAHNTRVNAGYTNILRNLLMLSPVLLSAAGFKAQGDEWQHGASLCGVNVIVEGQELKGGQQEAQYGGVGAEPRGGRHVLEKTSLRKGIPAADTLVSGCRAAHSPEASEQPEVCVRVQAGQPDSP